MNIKPIFAWYDLWIGVFWDQAKRRLYVFPIPMFGVVIQFADRSAVCVNHPGRRSFINLDGDDLCRPCASEWARGEGQFAAEQDFEDF